MCDGVVSAKLNKRTSKCARGTNLDAKLCKTKEVAEGVDEAGNDDEGAGCLEAGGCCMGHGIEWGSAIGMIYDDATCWLRAGHS